MNRVLISPRTDKKTLDFFQSNGYDIYHFAEMDHVYSSISDHLDTFMVKIDDMYVVDPQFYKLNKGLIDSLEKKIVVGNESVGATYPDTVKYNCVSGNGYIIHNFNHTDDIIKDNIVNKDIINVKQGYTNCSICKVDDKVFITSDNGINKVLKNKGYEVLLIDWGNIQLRDQSYGFIGGASGTLKDGSVLFTGDIRKHPSYREIDKFFKSSGVIYRYIEDIPLNDIGGFLVF